MKKVAGWLLLGMGVMLFGMLLYDLMARLLRGSGLGLDFGQ